MKEINRILEAKTRLMFLKKQNNIKDIVFINAVLEKYESILRIIGEK